MNLSPRRETGIAIGLVFVLTIAFDALGTVSDLVRVNLVAIFAAIFLYLPQILLPREADLGRTYGLSLRGARKGLAWGLVFSAITLVGFIPLNHQWNTRVLGMSTDVRIDNYWRPPEDYRGVPAPNTNHRLQVYSIGEVQAISWLPDTGPWSVEIQASNGIWRQGRVEPQDAIRLSGDTPGPVHVRWKVGRGSETRISGTVGGRPLGFDDFEGGAIGHRIGPEHWEDGEFVYRASLIWILVSVFLQLLVVALPEEFFYRGYLLQRLKEAGQTRKWHLGPIVLTQANLVVSVIFALGHLVIGWDPLRLAVFFPSLVFGWLRERTDGIVAPIVFHAASNLMVQLTMVHYV